VVLSASWSVSNGFTFTTLNFWASLSCVVAHEIPFLAKCLLPPMWVLGNLPFFLKRMLMAKKTIAIPSRAMLAMMSLTIMVVDFGVKLLYYLNKASTKLFDW
jgi:hypothetical protein